VVGEAAIHAVSLTDAFERVARYVRLAVEGVRIGVDVNERSFTVMYLLLGGGANRDFCVIVKLLRKDGKFPGCSFRLGAMRLSVHEVARHVYLGRAIVD
jgi:hypothetical protein